MPKERDLGKSETARSREWILPYELLEQVVVQIQEANNLSVGKHNRLVMMDSKLTGLIIEKQGSSIIRIYPIVSFLQSVGAHGYAKNILTFAKHKGVLEGFITEVYADYSAVDVNWDLEFNNVSTYATNPDRTIYLNEFIPFQSPDLLPAPNEMQRIASQLWIDDPAELTQTLVSGFQETLFTLEQFEQLQLASSSQPQR